MPIRFTPKTDERTGEVIYMVQPVNEKPKTLRERVERVYYTCVISDEGDQWIKDALDQLDAMAAASSALLKRYEEDFCKAQDSYWGNMSDAYYMLAKNAQHDWKRLSAALARYEGRDDD